MPFHMTRKFLLAGCTVLLLGGAALGGAALISDSPSQATDDAYVTADFTRVAPRIAGQVERVFVEDNQQVKAGQLLAKIDDRDYRAALAAAEALVLEEKAEIASLDAEIARHPALVAQARAALRADRAAISFAQADAVRYHNLSEKGAGALQEEQKAHSALEQQRAAHERDSAALTASQRQLPMLEAARAEQVAELAKAEAALEQARLNLSYTEIRAPIDGMVGQRALRVGQFVTPGTHMASVVPLADAYILANFQENQLEHMRIGQPVRITVDSYPDLVLSAHVDSLAPATGLSFAPIAPDNATGNFTKVVQRIPVKIVIDKGQARANMLRVGMSVIPTVDVTAPGMRMLRPGKAG